MDIVKFLIRTKSIHIRVYAPAGLHIHLCQLYPLPFCKRMYNFCPLLLHVLNRECDRSLYTVQVIIQTGTAEYYHRSSDSEQCQLSGKIILKHILDSLDCLFCIFYAAKQIAIALGEIK